MKKKLVMIVEAMLGGIRQHVCDIAENLDRTGYEIYIIYSDLRADAVFKETKEELSGYAELICCNEMQRPISGKDFMAYKAIVKILREIHPDIVHCHSSKAGIVGRLAAKKCKVPLVIYTPNAYAFQSPDVSPLKKYVYIYAERLLSRRATSITLNVSKGEMKLAQDYRIDRPEKFRLIYNGIPQTELKERMQIRKELGLRENIFYVGVTARCAPQKDPFTFLEIAGKTVQNQSNIEFIYIGDGELQGEMTQWITEHGLEQKIHMLGFRTDAAVIVGALDLYLSTALYEGLPYSMIEAMRAGVPVIATDTVGNNELVFEGVNGKLFPVKDADRAVGLILEQYRSGGIEREKVKNTFLKEFSVEVMVRQLNEVYQTENYVIT
ncbi:MAG: glycosyltransferase [Blautia sp.]|nr:glycosyltransferase [Blautia sp.]